jgi:hypothetical protein
MKTQNILLIVVIIAIGVPVVNYLIRALWRLLSENKLRTAERPPTPGAARHSLWRDPGDIAKLDLRWGQDGQEGAPKPPFRFVKEHKKGTSPNVTVEDANKRRWRVKWGDEVKPEIFATRLVWAAGYFAESNFFIPEGSIEGAKDLKRAGKCINADGTFCDARFELDDKAIVKRFEEHGWSWHSNPFVGTHELNGLKILVMLLSNWDNKDQRDVARGSNMAIFYRKLADGLIEAQYLIIDWGGSMGKWGSNVISRGKWNAEDFAQQTPKFVTGLQNGVLQWGYTGQRTPDATEGISVEDVRWLIKYLGQITDFQIREALLASHASDSEIPLFTDSLRSRINQLKDAINQSALVGPS